jgi:hypothetical protein
MGAILAKLGTWLFGALVPYVPQILGWITTELQKIYRAWKDPREVKEIVDKIESPDLKEKLEGIEDAEDRLNRNT